MAAEAALVRLHLEGKGRTMLREIGLTEMRNTGIPKEQCVFVARKRGNDDLAPSEELFRDFDGLKKRLEGELGKGSVDAHNQAFIQCRYEGRYREQVMGNQGALKKLEGICRRANREDIHLVCYEGPSKACHRRILLRMAEELFHARVAVEGVEPI